MGKIHIKKKSRLVIDLDETILTFKGNETSVDTAIHQLKDYFYLKNEGDYPVFMLVAFLNPKKLKWLIKNACLHHAGVVFATSGKWDEDNFKEHLINRLNLVMPVSKMINDATFFNPKLVQEQYYPRKDLREIPSIPKASWYKKHLKAHPELEGTPLTVLDDNLSQLKHFAKIPRVTTVYSATRVNVPNHPPHDRFYRTTLDAMKKGAYWTTAENIQPKRIKIKPKKPRHPLHSKLYDLQKLKNSFFSPKPFKTCNKSLSSLYSLEL